MVHNISPTDRFLGNFRGPISLNLFATFKVNPKNQFANSFLSAKFVPWCPRNSSRLPGVREICFLFAHSFSLGKATGKHSDIGRYGTLKFKARRFDFAGFGGGALKLMEK